MAQSVYSTRFLGIGLLASSVSYIVPDGYVAVVRSVQLVYVGGPTAAQALLHLGGVDVPVALLHNTNGNDQLNASMRAVVEPEEPIRFSTSAGNTCYGYISGYLLTLP